MCLCIPECNVSTVTAVVMQAVTQPLGQGFGAGVGHSSHDLHRWPGHLCSVRAATARVLLGGQHARPAEALSRLHFELCIRSHKQLQLSGCVQEAISVASQTWLMVASKYDTILHTKCHAEKTRG